MSLKDKLPNLLTNKKTIRDYIKIPYYYVPPCPVCNSPMTGRFVKGHFETDNKFIEKESLKAGELTLVAPPGQKDNAFCGMCGYTWWADIQIKMISLAQRDEESKKRQAYKVLQEINEEEEKKKKKGPLRTITRFVGKI